MKRAFDIAASTVGILLLSPLFAVVSIMVWLHDRGPVFFRQARVGLGGKEFRIHKFRSMSIKNSGSLVTSAQDGRITPVGRFLRKSKLDELPQLIDVLVGDMSIVGPRPEVRHFVEQWDSEAREEILSVRPGITDPAAIAYRNEQDELAGISDPESYYVDVIMPRKVAMYREYVRNRTLLGDVRCVFQTVAAIFKS